MSVKPFGLLGNIKTADVFRHPVKAKTLNFNTYIYISYSKVSVFYIPIPLRNFGLFDIKSDLREFQNSQKAKRTRVFNA